MSRRLRAGCLLPAFLLFLADSPLAAAGGDVLVHVTLSAYWSPGTVSVPRSPAVSSKATVELYSTETGRRIYSQVILDHGVKDLTQNHTIYTARLESANGYIANSTRDTPGDEAHCYGAVATGHANSFNLHVTRGSQESCMPPPPERQEIPEENCPVLLDLEMDGFHLSGADPAVHFDIDADGMPDRIAWTRRNEDDAFLCLDRNGNGVIDDGSELFGYATRLLSGERAGMGYRALAELDLSALGGNGDGKIDAADGLFQSLCVWNDSNRDGISVPGEIRSAGAAGVVSLDYAYRTTGHRDAFGNLFRYVSRAEMRTRPGRVRTWLTYDVIFVDGTDGAP